MASMRLISILSGLIVVCAFAALPAFFFGQVCVATGTITVYGHPAEKGLKVEAFIGEDKVAQGLTEEQGHFQLEIPQYDPDKPDVKGYRSPNDVIQVKLNGKKAKPTFNPDQATVKVNLEVEQTLDVKLSTWGKIKALFE